MNRRTFLVATVPAGVAGISGCLTDLPPSDDRSEDGTGSTDSGGWDPTISGETPELAPGAETTITVEADPVGGFRFSAIPEEDGVEIATSLDAVSVSPSPDSGEDVYPPRWFWSSPTSATVEAPVSVADDAATGEYPYEVTVFAEEYSEESRSETFAVTVTGS